MKKDTKKRFHIIISVLIILFTLLFVFSVWKLVEMSLSYAQSSREYDELRRFITVDEGQSVVKTEVESTKEDSEKESAEAAESTDGADSAENTERGGKITCPVTVDFETLWEINSDIKGWIYLEEVDISYPIVQGKTNDDYLYTSVKGTANSGGSIFLDYRNAADFSDPHTIIYGHNMKNGSMFGSLKKLGDQERIDEMEGPLCFWIITPEETRRYDVISVRTVDVSGDTYTLFTGPGDVVGEYINQRARTSIVELDHRTYTGEDKIITLSTCTGNDQYRLVVHGVLHAE